MKKSKQNTINHNRKTHKLYNNKQQRTVSARIKSAFNPNRSLATKCIVLITMVCYLISDLALKTNNIIYYPYNLNIYRLTTKLITKT